MELYSGQLKGWNPIISQQAKLEEYHHQLHKLILDEKVETSDYQALGIQFHLTSNIIIILVGIHMWETMWTIIPRPMGQVMESTFGCSMEVPKSLHPTHQDLT